MIAVLSGGRAKAWFKFLGFSHYSFPRTEIFLLPLDKIFEVCRQENPSRVVDVVKVVVTEGAEGDGVVLMSKVG